METLHLLVCPGDLPRPVDQTPPPSVLHYTHLSYILHKMIIHVCNIYVEKRSNVHSCTTPQDVKSLVVCCTYTSTTCRQSEMFSRLHDVSVLCKVFVNRTTRDKERCIFFFLPLYIKGFVNITYVEYPCCSLPLLCENTLIRRSSRW